MSNLTSDDVLFTLVRIDHREDKTECLSCFGRGYWNILETNEQIPCPHCNGVGKVGSP